MPAPTGSLFNTHAHRVEEVINRTVGVFLPTFDRVWEDTIVTSQGVGPVSDFGRDFLILKVYQGGLTGVIEPGGPGSDFTLYGDPSNTALGSKLFTQGLSRAFPDATQGMNQATYRLGIPMRSMVTNLMLTLGELQAEATDAFIGEVIAPKMEGFARHMSQILCNYWYLSQNSYYALTTLNGASGTGWDKTQDTNTTLMVDTTYSNYAIDRLMVGMRVQIYDTTGTTLRQTTSLGANTVFVVSKVDEGTGKVYFKAIDGAALNAAAFADTDIVVLANSKGSSATPFAASPYFTGIAGINSWMKDGAGGTNPAKYLLGDERVSTSVGPDTPAIDVTTHPEFKSLFFNAGGNPLTEHYLRKVLRRFHAAKHKYGQTIDCLVASDGVWLAYEAQKIGRQWLDRTGRLSSIRREGSDNDSINDGITFEFDGRKYEGYTSTYIESNTMYGFKKKNNWKRYVPPDPKGVKRFERTEAWNPFRFVAGALTGTGSNQIPIFSVSNNRTFVTEGVQMPGMLRMQLVPDQVTGIKITNIAEDRIYAS